MEDAHAAACRAFADAQAAVGVHRRVQADAEIAMAQWLRKHRHVPADRLYGPDGKPRDRTLVDLEAAVDRAHSDVQWCRSVAVACGEAVKGEPFETAAARNDANRAAMQAARTRAIEVS